MIRFNILLLFLFFITLSALAQKEYKLSGSIENAERASIVYLYYSQQDTYVVDSCYVKEGSFSFSGSVEYPIQAMLELRNKNASLDQNINGVLTFYLENAAISITMDESKRGNETISGSRTQDLSREFQVRLQPIREEMDKIHTAYKNASLEQQASKSFIDSLRRQEQNVHEMNSEYIYQYIKKHPNDFISLYLLQSQLDNVPDDLNILKAFSSLSISISESTLGKEFASKLQKIKATSIGSVAPEFDCKDINGNLVKLSDFKGKYLLLMFWATDCSHCLEELSNAVKVFDLLAGEDFTILSVALDSIDRLEYWKDFVKSNQLPWSNLFDERVNGRKKISGLYNILQTPSNFLLNKDGTIIAKNLYGEDLLQRVSTILQLSRKIN